MSTAKPAGPKKGKKEKKHVVHGIVHIHASFNNTQVTITDLEGNVVCWSSAGTLGFKGSRKGTPFAAQQAATACANSAKESGLRSADIWTAIVLGHITRCMLGVLRFRQGRWRHIKVDIGSGRSRDEGDGR